MTIDTGLITWIAEALEPLGTLSRRRMMGGVTLYLDGAVFAIVDRDDALWFKADAASDAFWDGAGCARFAYERDGTIAMINYRRAPDEVYDDAEAMQKWAAPAIAAGRRAPRMRN
ncbi:TfoX/Sxy family protein [Sphingomonas sp. TX0543]|uniref:TfoX/Sxy family protein n=1 Tax=unclassified Sphingomonas TaxID=196159 RepID=UPI0010F558B4|nr:TfoX/Sxy family protein [Sphingomonas sp. 3P27F8]